MAAFFHGSQLVFEVHATGAGADHRLHQLVGVQHAAETGFGIGHDRCVVVNETGIALLHAFGVLDFVGTGEGVVDALDHLRHRVNRIQRLVRIHGGVFVVVGGNLPAGQVDGLDAGFHQLHRLTAGQCAQTVDVRLVVHQIPQLLGTVAGQGVLYLHGAAQALNVSSGVATFDAFPARIGVPVVLDGGDALFASSHGKPFT
ncbi:hypothetical protein D3C78_1302950 [compost metagenome]